MKKILFGSLAALLTLFAAGCQQDKQPLTGTCRIHGTISEQYNDRRIFLVPLEGRATADRVDSVEVKDGKFEFTKDTAMMAKVLMDYHYRMGLEPLLVVTEPGDVTVVIDSISHATGTPQNDSLEKWKGLTETHNRELAFLRRTGRNRQADSLHLAYKLSTRQLAKNMKETVLGRFLQSLYPNTYKKVMPDGTTVTIDADTHEPVSK